MASGVPEPGVLISAQGLAAAAGPTATMSIVSHSRVQNQRYDRRVVEAGIEMSKGRSPFVDVVMLL
jgi:hypothetical protein